MTLSSSGTDVQENELAQIGSLLKKEGFERFGFATLSTPVSIGLYENWLERGFQGEMLYLERHLADKRDPERLLPKARSAIVVTTDYLPHPAPLENFPLSRSSQVALYARGRDYHHFIRERLGRVIEALRAVWPNEQFTVFADSSPVLERDLAVRAGLGWIGKNTCLIDRRAGSLFFVAEIYTTLDLPAAKLLSPDHCGTCRRCLDACPTGALIAPRELDARLCISYLTIESRGVAPTGLREKIGAWLFGCDICQTVCPWNIKIHGKDRLSNETTTLTNADERQDLVADLRMILTSSNRAIERKFHATPLARAGAMGLKRNSLYIIGCLKLHELRREVESLLENNKLGELAKWAEAQITGT